MKDFPKKNFRGKSIFKKIGNTTLFLNTGGSYEK